MIEYVKIQRLSVVLVLGVEPKTIKKKKKELNITMQQHIVGVATVSKWVGLSFKKAT